MFSNSANISRQTSRKQGCQSRSPAMISDICQATGSRFSTRRQTTPQDHIMQNVSKLLVACLLTASVCTASLQAANLAPAAKAA